MPAAHRASSLVAMRILLLAAVVALCACQATRAPSARAAGELRWGGDAEGGAPFVEADPADPSKVRGFDVEIAGMIARGLGRQAALRSGGVGVDRAVGRARRLRRRTCRASRIGRSCARVTRFSIPYFEFREVLAVRPADRARYRNARRPRAGSASGRSVRRRRIRFCSTSATALDLVPISYDDDVHPYADLVAGRVDAVLLDNIIAERSLRRSGRFRHSARCRRDRALRRRASRQRDAALRDSANAILFARMRDGSLEKVFRAWNVWDDGQAQVFRARCSPIRRRRPARPRMSQLAGQSATYAPSAAARRRDHARALAVSRCRSPFRPASSSRPDASTGQSSVRGALAVYVEVVRGTPVLLQLFVIYYGLSGVVRLPAFAAAVLGLGLNYAAYESEIYRAALEAIARPQLEAARTLGLSEFQILRLVRGPQALRLALAPMTNDFVALLKDSSLVSVITVVELTKQTAIYATNVGSWVVPGMLCAAIYLALSLPLSRAARRLERRWSVS